MVRSLVIISYNTLHEVKLSPLKGKTNPPQITPRKNKLFLLYEKRREGRKERREERKGGGREEREVERREGAAR